MRAPVSAAVAEALPGDILLVYREDIRRLELPTAKHELQETVKA